MAKTFVPNGKTRIGDARCFGNGFEVFVKCDKTPLGAQPQQDAPRMPSPPEGAIHPGACRLGPRAAQQGVHGFIKQNGSVLQRSGCHGQKEKSLKTSGISPCMALASCSS